MHIPDGFLDPIWCAATYVATLAYLAVSLQRVRGSCDPTGAVPLVAVFSAVVFVAQMLNWPLPGGTSLHFLGSSLLAIVLKPYLASLSVFLVLLVQALVFHDGGITTLGANALNMGVVAVWVGYWAYALTRRLSRLLGEERARALGSFLSGWLSVTAAGVATGFEIGLSSAFPYGVLISVPVMAAWHAALGTVEGLITALVVNYLALKHPEVFAVGGGVR